MWTTEGVRGRYLNELTRPVAAGLAGALASYLWDGAAARGAQQLPPVAPAVSAEPGSEAQESPAAEPVVTEGFRLQLAAQQQLGPRVVLAHDARPSSPDLVTGAGQALRRMGCQVIDIGVSTRPALLWAIDHLQAGGGLHVTGAGCDPGWSGFDFFGPDGIPCSRPGQLDLIATRHRDGYSRPARAPGSQRTFAADVPYQSGLWKHFHALRPLKIALACPSPAVLEVLQQIFRKLACRLIPVATPVRTRAAGDIADPDVARTAATVRDTQAHLGLLIEDDGEQCTIFDERGAIVAPRQVARLLASVALAEHPQGTNCVAPGAWQELVPGGRLTGVEQPTREAITRACRQKQAGFGADGQGRYWFGEAYPACDAILTLVHLLQALSRSDTPFSEVVD